jgi:hypothetical protein
METRWGLQLAGVDTAAAEPESYWTWRKLGFDEWNMRLGGLAAGVLAIPVLALISAPFLGRAGALIFALLLAIHPWHLEWSQNARFYSPMFLYYNGALGLYLAAVVRDRIWPLVPAVGLALLAVAIKPTSLMLLGVVGIDLLVTRARSRKLPLRPLALAIVVVGGLACAALAIPAITADSGPYQPPLERAVSFSPPKLWAFHTFTVGVPLAAAAAASALWLVRRREHERVVVFLAAAVGVPLVAFGVLALITNTEIRYTFVGLYGWLALAALGLTALLGSLRPLGIVPALLPIAVITAQLVRDASIYYESGYGNRPRWRHAFDYIAEHRMPGEGVVTIPKWTAQYYLEDPSVLNVDLDFESLEKLSAPTWFALKTERYELGEGQPHWLDGRAEMRAVYPQRIPFPQTTIRVYYYRPPSSE